MRYLPITAMAAALTACAPVRPVVSAADADPLRREVVADVTTLVAAEFDTTVTAFDPVSQEGALRSALLASLRASGFRLGHQYPGAQRFDCEVVPLGGHQYLVKVSAGRQTLSRMWVADAARAYHGGAWTRSE